MPLRSASPRIFLLAHLSSRTMQCSFTNTSDRPASLSSSDDSHWSPSDRLERLAADNAVVVFSASSCCMCLVVKRLFCSLGVNITVYELDEEVGGEELKSALAALVRDGQSVVPAVFVGGKCVGGLDQVMAAHISGTLVPLLKKAGALWL